MAEDKVIDKSEEEQLCVLEEKREAHKRLKSRMRQKATKSLIRKVKRYEATLRKSQETEKEDEETEAGSRRRRLWRLRHKRLTQR